MTCKAPTEAEWTRLKVREAELRIRKQVMKKLSSMRGRWEYDTKSNLGNTALREAMAELSAGWACEDRTKRALRARGRKKQ